MCLKMTEEDWRKKVIYCPAMCVTLHPPAVVHELSSLGAPRSGHVPLWMHASFVTCVNCPFTCSGVSFPYVMRIRSKSLGIYFSNCALGCPFTIKWSVCVESLQNDSLGIRCAASIRSRSLRAAPYRRYKCFQKHRQRQQAICRPAL